MDWFPRRPEARLSRWPQPSILFKTSRILPNEPDKNGWYRRPLVVAQETPR
jgi:hypothetical protein